jgi:hypothetical protein
MKYTEYNEENVDLQNLETSFISEENYKQIHESTVILCHDVFIRYKNNNTRGILLVKRLREPAKDILWPIGGRILRGKPTEESLSLKVMKECGLTLENIQYVGTSRTFFGGEPFGHTHGTDTLNLVYIADGKGEITLDSLHSSPILITKDLFYQKKYNLPKYVEDFLKIIDKNNLW